MQVALAAAPILVPVALLLVLRRSAALAGAAGLAVALALTGLVPDYGVAAAELGRALTAGVLATMIVSYVLLGGMLLHGILREAGALDAVAGLAAGLVPDPGRRALIFVLGFSVFLESATGFGIGIVFAAPLFLALGYAPRHAAILALAGQCAVTWGALGIGTVLGAELTGVPVARVGFLAAPLTLPLMLLCGAVALWLSGGRSVLIRRLPELLLYAVLLAVVAGAGSLWLGVEVAGMIGGLAVAAAGLAVDRLTSGPAGAGAAGRGAGMPGARRALVPFALLLAMLLATRLVSPLGDWLSGVAVIEAAGVDFRLPLLYHPGFWLLLTALFAARTLGVTGARLTGTVAVALRQWLMATLAVAGFLCFSQIMFATGMTAALAEAVAQGTGRFYAFLLPLVGALGGFLTASNAGSNAMFVQFQTAVGERLGLPVDVVAAAQNAAGANMTLASPGRVVLAAAVVGLAGREAELMRPALVLALAGLAGSVAILWGWIGG
jgi:lactate permease